MESRWQDTWNPVLGSSLRGGQGTSFLATRKDGTPGRVFIKQLRKPRNMEARKQFRREVAAYETLDHRGLPTLLADNSASWRDPAIPLFLVLECIEGTTLDSVIHEHGPMPIETAVACVLSIAESIAYCHAEGVLHRDLKPSNVMLRDGNPATPVVMAFGLSFNVGFNELGDVAQSEEEIGTRFLRLPEAWSGNQNAISDVTQLAGVFLFALTGIEPRILLDQDGNMPHRRGNEGTLLRALALDDTRFLRLMSLFDRAFATPSAERFQSAAEFRSAVEAIVAPVPDTADLDGLLAHFDEILGQASASRQEPDAARLISFVDHATSVMMGLAESKGLRPLRHGYVYKPGHVDLSLMRQTDTALPPYAQYRFESRGTLDVVLKVDGEEIWTGRTPADPGLTTAIQLALVASFLRTHHGPETASSDQGHPSAEQ